MEKREILHSLFNKLTYPMTVLGQGVEHGVRCKEAMETLREMIAKIRSEVKNEATDH